MTAAAFSLVLVSAVLHATWNFLLKNSNRKAAFFWVMSGVSLLLTAPPAIAAAIIDGAGWGTLGLAAGTFALHGAYAYTLTGSYQRGDLSSVYPVARGMGPAFVPLFAVLLLGESVSAVAVAGIALVVIGIYATHIDSRLLRDLSHPLRMMTAPATRLAFLTGAIIAGYSLWDKYAINEDVSPLTVNGIAMAGNFLALAPFAVLAIGKEAVLEEWQSQKRSIIAGGIAAPLGYALILIALTTSRVSYIAPAREVGIVLGTAMGVLLLGEGYGLTRIWGAALIVAGCIVLGVAP